ncbi:hypothetical protein MOE05_22005, partial [Bacillus atrophaeus]|nr:hypothetical protein [Bacillus atrophaeus]
SLAPENSIDYLLAVTERKVTPDGLQGLKNVS